MSPAPRPGWYPDPAGIPDLYRWWDGGGWTEAISESPRAPTPPTQSPAAPEDELSPRRPSRFRSMVALVVCLALFLSATVGLGLVIWHEPPRARTGPLPAGGASPAASEPAGGLGAGTVDRLDETTRRATVGDATLTLPSAPYDLSAEPLRVAGLLEVFFLASAPVHERYDGQHSWTAAVLVGRLSAPRPGESLSARGARAARQLSTSFFDGQRTKVAKLSVADHAVDGCRGVLVTAEVHYDVPRLASRSDRLSALVVGLDDGSVVAAVSSVPDDADGQVRTLAAAALASLQVS